jgi:hypothetical protein
LGGPMPSAVMACFGGPCHRHAERAGAAFPVAGRTPE